VSQSPIEQLLEAIGKRDVEGAMALMAPDCRLLAVDGRRAEGEAGVRELFTDFVETVRSTTHRITAQWHQDDVWIAEVEASYELRDWSKISALPRACVLREGPDGVAELHFYGAHERQLSDHRSGEEGMRIGGRWIPPL
jgi:ketosteroid isomerase-like protein